mmetsp:Transcript_13121/g.37751  ORF Transcript_13121/g.37751 Transcript_13121/m.37751 type:complete len:166 (+) Transcript_13121:118-615(+)
MTGADSKGHVHFDALDPEAEEKRSARGQEHRKEVVRGIKWHAESEKSVKVVQMKDGYEFIKNLKNFGALSQHTLGVQLTVQGFLAFFHKLSTGEEASQEDMESLFKDFQESGKAPEELGPRLQEHLVLIALHTAEDGYYGLPLAEHPIVDSGDESDSKKPRLDKP